jgi:hypothetical protein
LVTNGSNIPPNSVFLRSLGQIDGLFRLFFAGAGCEPP